MCMSLLLSAIALLIGASFFEVTTFLKDDKPYELPKIIWLYWEGEMNQEVRYLLHNLKEKVPTFTLIFVTDSTINLYMDRSTIPHKLRTLPKANKADFYRLQLLYQYGGLWMDATTYVHNETFLEDCYRNLTKAKADLLGFNSYWPPMYHIELGFIMAPKGSPLLGKVLREFRIMMSMGIEPYMKDRIHSGIIIKSHVVHKFATKTEPEFFGTYFAPYVCFQTVIQREYKGNPNIILMNSEESFYKLAIGCDWDGWCMAHRWENDPEIRKSPITKFYSGSRGKVKFPDVDFI